MSHQDVCAIAAAQRGGSSVCAAWIEQLVHGSILEQIRFRKTARWSPLALVITAVLWGLGEAATLRDRFASAMALRQQWFPVPHQGLSYQAFLKQLVRWTPVLVAGLLEECRRWITRLTTFTDDSGFVLLGIDGTRLAVPRSRKNEQALAAGLNPACRRRGRKRRQARIQAEIPSLWLTLLWHMGSGLPWLWQVGKANASERDHLRQMIPCFPPHTLLTADAGYAGYDYWKSLLENGVHLLIRVGSGVSLLHQLGRWTQTEDRVWLWPDRAACEGHPPLKLRLVRLKTNGKTVWLVTSVLSPVRLSERQIGDIYRRRWGIEVFFRDFKQTLQRHKLLSRTPQHVVVELHWSLLGLTLTLLQAKQEQQKLSSSVRTSVSAVLRVVRHFVRWGCENRRQIREALQGAVIDHYVRRRKTRTSYPRKRRYKPPGPPKIHPASPQINALAESMTPLTLHSYG